MPTSARALQRHVIAFRGSLQWALLQPQVDPCAREVMNALLAEARATQRTKGSLLDRLPQTVGPDVGAGGLIVLADQLLQALRGETHGERQQERLRSY